MSLSITNYISKKQNKKTSKSQKEKGVEMNCIIIFICGCIAEKTLTVTFKNKIEGEL